MTRSAWLAVVASFLAASRPADSCCPAPPSGKPVVNADQTVIIVWDAATKTQHFIRKASFKSGADDFGFIVPSPTQPTMFESKDEAFGVLAKLTEPEVITQKKPSGGGCGIGCEKSAAPGRFDGVASSVTVLEQATVAGFDATVLAATSATALTDWLKANGYAHSPEIAAWAKPYVEGGWKFTALKVAKKKSDETASTAALRLSFQTDRPLFPYREPDPTDMAKTLKADKRLLRIYFLSDARFRGDAWQAKTVWAGKVSPESRKQLEGQLGLKSDEAAAWHLTEFEDDWPYRAAAADVYFSPDVDQKDIRRDPIVRYVSAPPRGEGAMFVFAAALIVAPLLLRFRRSEP